jgi:hypothetical protein
MEALLAISHFAIKNKKEYDLKEIIIFILLFYLIFVINIFLEI